MGLPRGARAAAMTLLLGAPIFLGGCTDESASAQSTSITVELPPARPYKRAAVSPGFSEPLAGAIRG